MKDDRKPEISAPDPNAVLEAMAKVAAQSQRVIQAYLTRQCDPREDNYSVLDPLVIAHTFQEVARRWAENPWQLADAQWAYWQACSRIWQSAWLRLLGLDAGAGAVDQPEDKRFQDDAWREHPFFDLLKQSYWLTARHVRECLAAVEGLDRHTAVKADFYTRLYLEALSPSNFVATNPKVLRKTVESGGENLLKGLQNMLDDLERGAGRMRVKMTNLKAFKPGENVAVTPGKVVFQNELMQLLQYAPATEQVFKRPLLIIPPWINKFYILDLRAKNSFIKWAVDEGHTVFVISWVNPDQRLAEKRFEDYLREGPLAALEAIERATGEPEVKAIGYCLGGTLLAITLAYLAAQGKRTIQAATFFTTMVDFSEVGELEVFIDEEQLALIDAHMARTGYFEGQHMADAFNLLRANELIWSFVINQYLLGQEPLPFDLLYWNSDSTRMPRAMHSYYLRNMYQRNLLREPGGLSLAGTPIDLRQVDVPCYLLATREDHIAPWKSTYAATQLYAGPLRFVLGGSGHIAGVINPPSAHKYGYWTGERLPPDPDVWLVGAEAHEGSWWLDWREWVAAHNGDRVPARVPGAGGLPALEEAPGSYVKVSLIRTTDERGDGG